MMTELIMTKTATKQIDYKEKGVNPIYESVQKALMYEATQEYVAPKRFLYSKAIELISETQLETNELIIYDLGAGVGAFLFEFLNSPCCEKFSYVKYYCVDLSLAMLDRINVQLEDCLYEHENVDIELVGGANLANKNSPFFPSMQNANIILTSQLEHYLPNSINSKLADYFVLKGIDFLTKELFREKCRESLKDNGLYLSIDDREGESVEEEIQLLKQWDGFVYNNFSNQTVIDKVAENYKEIAEKLNKQYSAQDMGPKKIGRIREIRRNTSFEEIDKLSNTREEFEALFGKEATGVILSDVLSKFYLMWGSKK
jgi:SAM-dependent methyltransferase